ncbi:hypothetical protein HQ489_04480 [Candidatus Woesearchaeota archaeon]|nr:hypothetical protein [Candidatus Woesearchaeota archaeon]
MKLSTLEFDVIQLKHRDYQILHDKYKRPKYEIIINITKDWDSLVGGNVFYVNGSGDYLELPGIGNVITITKTSILRHFIKYINFYADKDKRVLLLAKIF